MSIRKFASAVIAVALAIAPALLSASDQPSQPTKATKAALAASAQTTSTSQFATLKGVKGVRMSPREMDAVKGLHVHFITLSNGKLHIAGNPELQNNWENIGGTDGLPVAPSYNGLCKAQGNGSIFIPTGRGNPVTTQCPPGS